jgi:hypothetical protein
VRLLNAGLLRYAAVDWVRSQRWLPPTLILLVTLLVITTADGRTVAGYGVTSALLFPLTAWLTVGALNSEEPEQRWVTSVTAGGLGRVIAARVTVALVWAWLLGLLAVTWPLLLEDPSRKGGDVLVGLLAHAICAAGGAGLGVVLARPLVNAPGYVALGVVLLFMVELGVRFLPPVGPVVVELVGDGRPDLLLIALTGLETVLLFGALGLAGTWVARQRG